MRTGMTERYGVIERDQQRPEKTDRDRVTQRSTRSLRQDRHRNNIHPETARKTGRKAVKKRDSPVKTSGVFLKAQVRL